MDVWQRNMRMIHQISEFVDFDSAQSDPVADFISLIQAMREGLTQIDDNFSIPDAQINTLFLTKLKSRTEWDDWATDMLQDSRINAPNPANRMTFQELAELAVEHEKFLRGEKREDKKLRAISPLEESPVASSSMAPPPLPEDLSQDEINEFVMQQMSRDDRYPKRRHTVRGHNKRPSQEEINEYVIQQMRRVNFTQHDKSRNRSHSQPEPGRQNRAPEQIRTPCTYCGDLHHQSNHCWRRWRVAVESPPGNFETPGELPIYRTGFTFF
ncbi:hypothetical protein EYZ11_010069 [Aspergillus tanneri]|uniref:Uncharacterized protein n=1 Tax=Aspergillus tanneri TaxID=1220188 RepID=A0A4S3J695_9EURO|nr:uncharacterized protein ATNIH1004_009008 [Aspergillus tanneri]KAA8644800.1 hypothetical protein ATNIH1004_009008 [Aspergillus tanneri]THC90466.1 hypothetical protein EYZ11_010069 [Aspergillus tanneri]